MNTQGDNQRKKKSLNLNNIGRENQIDYQKQLTSRDKAVPMRNIKEKAESKTKQKQYQGKLIKK